jgi:hypothetical protein
MLRQGGGNAKEAAESAEVLELLALAALPGLRRGWSHSSDASNNSGLEWKTFQKRASQNRRMGIMVIHGDKIVNH